MTLLLVTLTGCTQNEREIKASGTIEATEVIVRTEVAGVVKEVSFSLGDAVKENDQLIKIDDFQYRMQLEQAEAQQGFWEAQLEELKSGVRPQRIEQARNNLEQIQAAKRELQISANKAKEDLVRYQKLYDDGAVSQNVIEGYKVNYQQLQSRIESIIAQENAAKANLALLQEGSTQYAISAMENQVKQAQAGVEIKKRLLSKTQILSPLNGIIASKLVEKGEVVGPMQGICTIMDLSHLWINVYIPDKALGRIKLGQKVEISVIGIDEKLSGKITQIAAEAEFTPLTTQSDETNADQVFAVRIDIPHDDRLKPGMSADVIINE
jgi:HlyD family secretion protein